MWVVARVQHLPLSLESFVLQQHPSTHALCLSATGTMVWRGLVLLMVALAACCHQSASWLAPMRPLVFVPRRARLARLSDTKHEGLGGGDSSPPAPPPPVIVAPAATPQLSFSQLIPFLKIAKPFFQEDKVARDSLIGVVALTLLNSGVSVAFSYISRDFYSALNARNEAVFYEKIELFFAALVIAVPISVYYRFLREKLSLYWREALTRRVLDLYYADRTFYIIETLRDVDNPDQRITEDIRQFTRASLDFFITLFTSAIDLVSFSAILFGIYPGLFVAIIAYAGAGSLVTTNLGKSLVALNYNRLIREADFRFGLIRTRENAEAIAFYDSSASGEKDLLWKNFQEVLTNQMDIILVQRNLEYFTQGYRYLVQILPSLIVAPLFFANKVELGAVTQSYGAFNHILGDFSILINQFESLSAFSAGLTRLSTFLERLDATAENSWNVVSTGQGGETVKPPLISLEPMPATFSSTSSSTSELNDCVLSCRNLTVMTPDMSRVLIGGGGDSGSIGIDIDIHEGDRMLIAGPSGSGKSSFVRAVAGLWQVGSGSILWRPDLLHRARLEGTDVFFLPQRPYNIIGSLKEQIMYPNNVAPGVTPPGDRDGNHFLEILQKVRLHDLALRMGNGDQLAGLEVRKDWTKVLSLGEQQRLAFARVVYNRPKVVFLDESTSALDLPSEEALYLLLQDLGVTYISVGHRPSLLRFHSSRLRLAGKTAAVEPITALESDAELRAVQL